jgi:hypothetical protein
MLFSMIREKVLAMLGYRNQFNYGDAIRSEIINSINNESYNNYFPVSNPIDDGWRKDKKDKKRNPLVICPSRRDEN